MRIHKNSLFLGFLGLLAAAASIYSAIALYKYYRYAVLDSQAPAQSIEWSIKVDKKKWPLSLLFEDNYRLLAMYSFSVEGKAMKGSTSFKENYLNSWAAEQAIKKNEQKNWIVWYQSGKVNHSTLQKNFPLKECVSAGVLWALLLYFIWLGFYVANYRV
jgi:hypothetical protein